MEEEKSVDFSLIIIKNTIHDNKHSLLSFTNTQNTTINNIQYYVNNNEDSFELLGGSDLKKKDPNLLEKLEKRIRLTGDSIISLYHTPQYHGYHNDLLKRKKKEVKKYFYSMEGEMEMAHYCNRKLLRMLPLCQLFPL